MLIQNILWPKIDICNEEQMYFRKDKYVKKEKEECLIFEKDGKCFFDTYFNGVSIGKWVKYTNVKNVKLKIKIKGKFRIILNCKEKIHTDVLLKQIGEYYFDLEKEKEIDLDFGYQSKGMLCFDLISLEDDSMFYGGYYYTDNIDEKHIRKVKIGIDICTFKRETFIKRNIEILNKNILNNPFSPLKDNLEVFISDNGQTLDIDKLSSDKIHIVKNKNTGGAGGFTRGLLEIMKANPDANITHALLMDDDIQIEPESLLKTYTVLSLLKDEYQDAFIGGAMLRIDKQNIQVESGASWNAGKLISLKNGLDMLSIDNCLYNEYEEYREFNAWWYCCFPISIVNEENLPLPIFIRGDDLEYGLRNMKTLILMNGICVWHEPFENKYSSFLSYYILRNQLIDNALHCPQYSRIDFVKDLLDRTIREILYYRYKNVELTIRGVKDYFKGIDFLLNTDGEKLHKEIMGFGYKAIDLDKSDAKFSYPEYDRNLITADSKLHQIFRFLSLNGYLLPKKKKFTSVSMSGIRPVNSYRVGQLIQYDVTSQKVFMTERSFIKAIKCILMIGCISIKGFLCFNSKKKQYLKRQKEVQNVEFWKKYLKMNS